VLALAFLLGNANTSDGNPWLCDPSENIQAKKLVILPASFPLSHGPLSLDGCPGHLLAPQYHSLYQPACSAKKADDAAYLEIVNCLNSAMAIHSIVAKFARRVTYFELVRKRYPFGVRRPSAGPAQSTIPAAQSRLALPRF
jgi:hypothetical protein